MQSVQANHMSEYNILQKTMLDTQEQIRSKFELQVESQKQQIAKLQADLHAKMLSSEQQLGDLNQEKTTLEFQMRDLQRQFNLNEQDRKHLVQELDAYVAFKKEFEAERHSMQKEMVGIQSKLESMTLQIQDKELQIENHATLARAYQENKGNLEERLQVYAKQVQELENERKKWGEKYSELEKRIENKKEEMKEYYETLMVKNEVIRKQVRNRIYDCSFVEAKILYLYSQEASIEDLSKKYKETEEKLLQANEQVQQLQHQVTVTQQRLQEAQERIQESNQIIQENKGVSLFFFTTFGGILTFLGNIDYHLFGRRNYSLAVRRTIYSRDTLWCKWHRSGWCKRSWK
jgi:peptidoglycan hydrolase CwlO-like protein